MMILASAMRHSVGRPATGMGGGTHLWSGFASRRPACLLFTPLCEREYLRPEWARIFPLYNQSHGAIDFPAYSFLTSHTLIREVFSIELKRTPEVKKNLTSTKEINVTIHYADNGPSLTSCMISIVSSHMSKNANF